VPAVTLAAATPAFAASGTTLSFSSASYHGVACATIDDAVVRAANGATPEAGQSIVLQLSDGYTFDGGGVTRTVVTGSDGSVSCGTIHVPGPDASGTLAATASGATSASSTLTSYDARLVASPRGVDDLTGVPAGATPIAADLFLADDALHRAGHGAVATGVREVGRLVEAPSKNGSFLLPFRGDDRRYLYDTSTGSVAVATGVPSGASPVAGDLFLLGFQMFRGDTLVAKDVAAYGQLVEHDEGSGGTGQFFLPYRDLDGVPKLLRVPADDTRTVHEYGTSDGPPVGATPVADDLFFANGSLYRTSWDGSNPYGTGVVASGISSWGTLTPNPYYAGERLLPVVLQSGEAALFEVSGNTVRVARNVPARATPLGADLFLSGSAVYQDGVGLVASPVTSTGQSTPASAGSSRVVVPLMSTSATCGTTTT